MRHKSPRTLRKLSPSMTPAHAGSCTKQWARSPSPELCKFGRPLMPTRPHWPSPAQTLFASTILRSL
eukprot:6686882-Lingulodinium_polyedra.AAC.1